MDLALMKVVRVPHREDMRFEFRAEAFNATNRVNLGTPDYNVTDPNFGKIFNTYQPSINDPGDRIMQFGIKFVF